MPQFRPQIRKDEQEPNNRESIYNHLIFCVLIWFYVTFVLICTHWDTLNTSYPCFDLVPRYFQFHKTKSSVACKMCLEANKTILVFFSIHFPLSYQRVTSLCWLNVFLIHNWCVICMNSCVEWIPTKIFRIINCK